MVDAVTCTPGAGEDGQTFELRPPLPRIASLDTGSVAAVPTPLPAASPPDSPQAPPSVESISCNSQSSRISQCSRTTYLKYLSTLSRRFPQLEILRRQPAIQKYTQIKAIQYACNLSATGEDTGLQYSCSNVRKRLPDWESTSIALFRPRVPFERKKELERVGPDDTSPWPRYELEGFYAARRFTEFLNHFPTIPHVGNRPHSRHAQTSEHTIVLCEGLDFNTICALGTKYRINPEFFARHLVGAQYDGVSQIPEDRWVKSAFVPRTDMYRFKWLRPRLIPSTDYQLMTKWLKNKHYWTSFIRRPWHHLTTRNRVSDRESASNLETVVAWEEVLSIYKTSDVVIGTFNLQQQGS